VVWLRCRLPWCVVLSSLITFREVWILLSKTKRWTRIFHCKEHDSREKSCDTIVWSNTGLQLFHFLNFVPPKKLVNNNQNSSFNYNQHTPLSIKYLKTYEHKYVCLRLWVCTFTTAKTFHVNLDSHLLKRQHKQKYRFASEKNRYATVGDKKSGFTIYGGLYKCYESNVKADI
jgi:hypothetical protein